MKPEELYKAIGNIDEKYILEADERERAKTTPIGRYVAAACAAALAVSIALPNISANAAQVLGDLPVVGKYFQMVTIRHYEFDDGQYTLDADIPQIDSDAEVSQVNEDIETLTQGLVDDFIKEAEENDGDYKMLSVKYETVTDTDKYYTVKVTYVVASADGVVNCKYFTVDKETGEQIKLTDITANTQAINEEIKSQIEEQQASDATVSYYDDEDAFDEVAEDQDFYINEDGLLVICFNEGDIAPYYMGTIEFVMPGQIFKLS